MNDKKKNTASAPWNGPPPRTEAELLALEARIAKTALAKTARAAARNLLQLADPRSWTQEYPWKSTGVAAVAGFVVATRIPGKAESAAKIESAAAVPPETKASGDGGAWDMITSLLLSSGTSALKGVLTPWLAEKMQQALHRGDGASGEAAAEPAPIPSRPSEGEPS